MGRYRSGSLLLTALLGFVVALSVTGEAGASHFPMVYPATAKVCCVYGDARDRGRRLHDGYDLMGQRGDPIFASYAGRVTRAENGSRCSGYGKRVTVDHGAGYSTVYAHLDSILVREGDQVRQMQQIGTMGKTGNACTTPVHLHYEVRRLPPSCTDRRHSVCEALNLNQAIRQGQNVSAGSPIPAHFDLPGGPAPGSPVPGGPTDVADISATPTGAGYHLVAADGGVFSFGGAPFHG
ncbi:MAG: M23 family metallopeptidase, partial [Actinomycetota bacterium]|nr:M23 family metallopeptidase [Actinomycetota bacterium]